MRHLEGEVLPFAPNVQHQRCAAAAEASLHAEPTGDYDKGAFTVWSHTVHSSAYQTLSRGYTREIAKRNLPLVRKDLKEDDALNLFRGMGEMYKIELINDLNEDLTVYEQGNFVDLCRGPHLDRTSRIKHFKILSVAGAYWRGDEKNKMLQRLYATAYPTKEMLEEHLHRLEEAAKRDHRKLGKQLDLFSFHGESPGAVFFHPRGQIVWDEITRYWRDKLA